MEELGVEREAHQTVKNFFLLKYKCILMLTFILLSILEFSLLMTQSMTKYPPLSHFFEDTLMKFMKVDNDNITDST